jgi:hypothetical protein
LKLRPVGRYRFLAASDVEPVRRRKRKPVQFTFRMEQKNTARKGDLDMGVWIGARREPEASG